MKAAFIAALGFVIGSVLFLELKKQPVFQKRYGMSN